MYDPNERLQYLYAQWRYCRLCELEQRRTQFDFPLVFGEGGLRGVMFIGEGPGSEEEKSGRPFVGRSGRMLRMAMQKLGLRYSSYITNAVCCRSCGPAFNADGTPSGYTRNGAFVQRIKDKPPKKECMEMCLPRLYEQIYLVDPFIIVCLGAESAKLLSHKACSITNESGTFRVIEIPGKTFIPSLTAKKGLWSRKQGGRLVSPIERNQVQYLMMPLMHPAYVLRNSADLRIGNPLEKFMTCMRLVSGLYRNHVYEMTGETIPVEELTAQDLLHASQEDGED